MEGLKRCPFCGSEAEYLQIDCDATDHRSVVMFFRICCHKCNASPGDAYGRVEVRLTMGGELAIISDDRPSAEKAWNRRGFDDGETAGEPGDQDGAKDVRKDAGRYLRARLILNDLREKHMAGKITFQQYSTMRGQALAGDVDGAVKGLAKVLRDRQMEGMRL